MATRAGRKELRRTAKELKKRHAAHNSHEHARVVKHLSHARVVRHLSQQGIVRHLSQPHQHELKMQPLSTNRATVSPPAGADPATQAVGVGYTPEGLDQNPAYWELLQEARWLR